MVGPSRNGIANDTVHRNECRQSQHCPSSEDLRSSALAVRVSFTTLERQCQLSRQRAGKLPFEFECSRVLRLRQGQWAESEIRFFGSLRSGEISINDKVLIPLLGQDPAIAPVVCFLENFYEWSGYPFCNCVRAMETFCICFDSSLLLDAPMRCPILLRDA